MVGTMIKEESKEGKHEEPVERELIALQFLAFFHMAMIYFTN
jgi:hypothetical protein